MSAHRPPTPPPSRSTQWAAKYRELLKGYVSLMGGDAITPTRRALAETISTLQCELSQLTDRFANAGKGGSSEDLALFLKLSGNVAELLQGAGLAPTVQQPVSDSGGDDALEKLSIAFKNIACAREQDEAAGIFRDSDGSVIVDPMRIELEKQIYALKQRREHLHDLPAPLLLAAPRAAEPAPLTPAPPASASTTPAPSAPTASAPTARALTPEEARHRAMQPMFPAPVSNEPTATELFYERGGGGRPWWGSV
jgi:hypothetical protein